MDVDEGPGCYSEADLSLASEQALKGRPVTEMNSDMWTGTQVGNRSRADRIEFSRDLGESPRAALPEALPALAGSHEGLKNEPLGEPMSVLGVARLIGCSVWTVRHRLLRQGLPHFRVNGSRKLIFYRNQVIRWILEKQKERR